MHDTLSSFSFCYVVFYAVYYPHMPIGILELYRLLFLRVLVCVSLFVRKIFVTDISGVG